MKSHILYYASGAEGYDIYHVEPNGRKHHISTDYGTRDSAYSILSAIQASLNIVLPEGQNAIIQFPKSKEV